MYFESEGIPIKHFPKSVQIIPQRIAEILTQELRAKVNRSGLLALIYLVFGYLVFTKLFCHIETPQLIGN